MSQWKQKENNNPQSLFSSFFLVSSMQLLSRSASIFLWLEHTHHPLRFSETCRNLELNIVCVFPQITVELIGQVNTASLVVLGEDIF